MGMGKDGKLWHEYESQGWHMVENYGHILTNKGFPLHITRWENAQSDEQMFFIIDGDSGYCGAYENYEQAEEIAGHLAKINSYA